MQKEQWQRMDKQRDFRRDEWAKTIRETISSTIKEAKTEMNEKNRDK